MFEDIVKQYKNKSAFCKAMGISAPYLWQIEQKTRPVPPKLALALNRVHGVRLSSLRPDLYPPENDALFVNNDVA